eukprot:m.111465 g.111465  ORF g.111465 m.111465 type:complete len:183 (+) comp12764_c1_seq6:115-663(+)
MESERLLCSLEDNVLLLEKQVGEDTKMPLTNDLQEKFERLNKLIKEHKYVNKIWSNYVEIEKIVNLDQTEQLETADVSRAQVVLADEERLKEIGRKYDVIERNEQFLNSGPLQDVPSHATKLESLRTVHIDQINVAAEHRERVMHLLEVYNNIVMYISDQFVEWDAILSKMERGRALSQSSK